MEVHPNGLTPITGRRKKDEVLDPTLRSLVALSKYTALDRQFLPVQD